MLPHRHSHHSQVPLPPDSPRIPLLPRYLASIQPYISRHAEEGPHQFAYEQAYGLDEVQSYWQGDGSSSAPDRHATYAPRREQDYGVYDGPRTGQMVADSQDRREGGYNQEHPHQHHRHRHRRASSPLRSLSVGRQDWDHRQTRRFDSAPFQPRMTNLEDEAVDRWTSGEASRGRVVYLDQVDPETAARREQRKERRRAKAALRHPKQPPQSPQPENRAVHDRHIHRTRSEPSVNSAPVASPPRRVQKRKANEIGAELMRTFESDFVTAKRLTLLPGRQSRHTGGFLGKTRSSAPISSRRLHTASAGDIGVGRRANNDDASDWSDKWRTRAPESKQAHLGPLQESRNDKNSAHSSRIAALERTIARGSTLPPAGITNSPSWPSGSPGTSSPNMTERAKARARRDDSAKRRKTAPMSRAPSFSSNMDRPLRVPPTAVLQPQADPQNVSAAREKQEQSHATLLAAPNPTAAPAPAPSGGRKVVASELADLPSHSINAAVAVASRQHDVAVVPAPPIHVGQHFPHPVEDFEKPGILPIVSAPTTISKPLIQLGPGYVAGNVGSQPVPMGNVNVSVSSPAIIRSGVEPVIPKVNLADDRPKPLINFTPRPLPIFPVEIGENTSATLRKPVNMPPPSFLPPIKPPAPNIHTPIIPSKSQNVAQQDHAITSQVASLSRPAVNTSTRPHVPMFSRVSGIAQSLAAVSLTHPHPTNQRIALDTSVDNPFNDSQSPFLANQDEGPQATNPFRARIIQNHGAQSPFSSTVPGTSVVSSPAWQSRISQTQVQYQDYRHHQQDPQDAYNRSVGTSINPPIPANDGQPRLFPMHDSTSGSSAIRPLQAHQYITPSRVYNDDCLADSGDSGISRNAPLPNEEMQERGVLQDGRGGEGSHLEDAPVFDTATFWTRRPAFK